MVREVSRRYAKALYSLAKESQQQQRVFDEIRTLSEVFEKNEAIRNYIEDPRIAPSNKKEALEATFKSFDLTAQTKHFMFLLAEKNRLMFFTEITEAYQEQIDEDHGVTRGLVRSASPLNPEARKEIESIVTKVINKKVILNYKEDSSLIGGLVAQVGGWTLDDSLRTHLRRMKEDLKRRAASGITS